MFSHIDNSCTCVGKWCSSCGQVKCRGAFNRNPAQKDGLDNYCRACKKAWDTARRQGNFDLVREQRERAKSSATYHHKGVIPVFDHVIDNCSCSGKQCPGCEQIKCHGAFNCNERTKSSLQVYCRACQSSKSTVYYRSNLESERERARERGRTESRREYQKNWRRDNAEYMQEYHKVYRETHAEHMRENDRIWQQNNPEHVAARKANRRARKAQTGGSFTSQEWINLCAYYNYTCLRCGRQEPDIKLVADHVVPIFRGGASDITNIQPLCFSCNARKGTKIIDY